MKISLWKNGKKIKTLSASLGPEGFLVDKIRQPIMIEGQKVRLGDTVGEVTVLSEEQEAPCFTSRDKVYKGDVDFYRDRYMGALRMQGRPVKKEDWHLVKPYATYISVENAHDAEDYDFPAESQGWYFEPGAIDALIKVGYSVSYKGQQIQNSSEIL